MRLIEVDLIVKSSDTKFVGTLNIFNDVVVTLVCIRNNIRNYSLIRIVDKNNNVVIKRSFRTIKEALIGILKHIKITTKTGVNCLKEIYTKLKYELLDWI